MKFSSVQVGFEREDDDDDDDGTGGKSVSLSEARINDDAIGGQKCPFLDNRESQRIQISHTCRSRCK